MWDVCEQVSIEAISGRKGQVGKVRSVNRIGQVCACVEWLVCLWGIYILATTKVISRRVPTGDNA